MTIFIKVKSNYTMNSTSCYYFFLFQNMLYKMSFSKVKSKRQIYFNNGKSFLPLHFFLYMKHQNYKITKIHNLEEQIQSLMFDFSLLIYLGCVCVIGFVHFQGFVLLISSKYHGYTIVNGKKKNKNKKAYHISLPHVLIKLFYKIY